MRVIRRENKNGMNWQGSRRLIMQTHLKGRWGCEWPLKGPKTKPGGGESEEARIQIPQKKPSLLSVQEDLLSQSCRGEPRIRRVSGAQRKERIYLDT